MKKAFTLLEVLLTVSLMMIILSIGWIKFQPMLAIRENQEVRQLLRDLNYTRNIAIRSNRSATFRITAETSYQIDAESEMIERDLQSVRIVKYPSQQISYRPTGAPKLNYTILLQGRTKQYRITSTVATGKVQIYEN